LGENERDTKGYAVLKELLDKRRSIRRYNDKALTSKQLEKLCWAGYGIAKNGRRTVPSAGASYPMELYVVWEGHIYHYLPLRNDLEKVETLDSSEQVMIFDAGTVIVVAANYDKTTKRYGKRGFRYVHMEAGHIGQNISLQAIEMGLGTVMIGAFRDGKVKRILKIDENPLYLIRVGYYD
jgi:SagB-type dehydrogenase family enzyme